MIRHPARLALGAATLLLLGGVAVGIAPAFAAGSVTATYLKTSDWGTGWSADYTVTNGTTSAVNGWTVVFTLPAGSQVTTLWDGVMTRSGDTYSVRNPSWGGTIAAGGTAKFGFNGSGPGLPPTSCTVNGAPCGGGPAPTTAPTTTRPPTNPPTTAPPTTAPTDPPAGDSKVVGYFAQWGVYGRQYFVKNIHTSGSAAKLTHIMYAFGNTTGGRCTIGDSYADYDMAYTTANSVDGVADTWDPGALRGNFGQLRRLKRMYPHLKVVWSFGGWTWSGGFTQAAQNPTAFAESCYQLVEDPRWSDVFDGIDVDWEYPNACGLTCDTSGPNAFDNVVTALRNRFGASNLVTAAITADGSTGGKIDATDYAAGIRRLDWVMPMTYDYFGAWAAQGPTAPHSPLTSYPGIPQQGFWSDAAVGKLKGKGVPAGKILLGIGFYGRGWTGVTQAAPGGTASGAAPGTYEAGIEDYKVLKTRCPATGTVGGTAYAFCGGQWWSYDTPATIGGKMTYARSQGLGGAFFWELSGDTGNGELVSAIRSGLG